MNTPLISIVSPTHNRLSFLKESLQSVAGELDPPVAESIVVDDESSDRTWNWLRTEASSLRTGLTAIRLDKNMGPGGARNAGLDVAKGRYLLPLDSDMLLIPGAGLVLQTTIAANFDAPLLLFPCIEYPAMRRMDSLQGNRMISAEDLLYERVKFELIPVVNLAYLKRRKLRYPEFRSGGEGILWIRTISEKPAVFVDAPLVYYRTDAPGRICTAGYQLKNSAELAEIADTMLTLFPECLSSEARRAKGRRLLAAGTYYLLAGNILLARKRLWQAVGHGNKRALAVLGASSFGVTPCRTAFRTFRQSDLKTPKAEKPQITELVLRTQLSEHRKASDGEAF